MLARAVVSTATRRVELREIEIGAVGAVSRQRPRAGRGGLGGCYEAASLAGVMEKWLQCCSTRPPPIFSNCGDWWRTP